MALELVTAPAVEPVTLAEAKSHLRLDPDGTDENALIADLIRAARENVENFTHRAIIAQTWDLKLDGFPGGPICLPFPPLLSVTSITYLDGAGVSQTWASSNYIVDKPSGPFAQAGRIYPAYGVVYPTTRGQVNAVAVRFVAGYHADAETSRNVCPAALKQGIKFLVANWYLNAEPTVLRGTPGVLPFGLEADLWPFKAF